MTRKVLVTGAGGYIGRHTLRPLLGCGYEVHAVTSRVPPGEPGDVTWHAADLLTPADARRLIAGVRPTHLLHLVWYTEHGKYWTSPENLRWVEASLRLVREFADHGGRRAVMAGSCAEYDWRYGYCSEGVTPIAPATLYGVSKAAAYEVAAAYARTVGMSLATGRVFFPFGPGEPAARLIPSVARAILTRQPVRCSDGELYRDFVFVRDCGDAFAALVDSPVEGAVNIGSGRPRSIADVVRLVAGLVPGGDSVPVEFGSVPIRAGDPPVLVADVRRLTGEVGWTPRTEFAEAMAETVEYWRTAELIAAGEGR